MDEDQAIETAESVIVTVRGDALVDAAPSSIALDLSKFPGGRWALQLDSAFARRGTPAVILAQGVACLAVAWWAQLSPRSYMAMIRGALFFAPLDIRFGQEAIAASARLSPATRLPFPSLVANASYPFVNRLLALADGWGSDFLDLATPLEARPSNRHAPRSATATAARLAAYLPLLQPAAPTALPQFEATTPLDTHRA